VQRITNTHQLTNVPRRLLLWLCGLLAIVLTMSHHWVICTHDDGHAHLEINHAQGDPHQQVACDCHRKDDGERDGDGEHPGTPHNSGTTHDSGTTHNSGNPHDTCSHIDLLVEVGPEQEPDSLELPLLLAFELPSNSRVTPLGTATKHSLPPPATGPPRPRSFLAVHATQVLLI
jgi:hypothetical protein